ncbi:MAG: S41 family peptidase [Candidatus Heimdallarchaeota archaeon]
MKVKKNTLYFAVLVITGLFTSSWMNHGYVSASTEMIPENTVILSNETDEAFYKDFSVLLRRVRPEWILLDAAEVPESVRDKNLIIIGELDSEYTGTIITEFLTQEELEYIQEGHYSVLKRESSWTADRLIYICVGSDELLTKKAAEEAITSLDGEWTFPPFSSTPHEVALEYITQLQYIPENDELPKETLRMEIDPKPPSSISAEEAAEDVEHLFYLFSHGYCGYGYFITQGNFDEAKQIILSELETKPQWSPEDFSQLLHDHLTFIHDCHLSIGAHKYGNHEDYWYDTSLELWKVAGEYFFSSDDTMYRVVSINGENPEEFMFPSLNAQGDPIYRIGMLSQAVPNPLELIATHDYEQHQFPIQLDRSDFVYFSDDIFREDTIGGIPVVRIRSFSDHHAEDLTQFLKTAEKYRGNPCLIMDIRGNGGGNEMWPKTWVTRFTGLSPSGIRYFTEFISKTTMMGRVNVHERLYHLYPDTPEYKQKMEQYEIHADAFEKQYTVPYWTGPYYSAAEVIPNDTTVIVIINGYIGSAAEGFINYLSQVENVVFVGENSGGALVFGQVSNHRLPHSTLLVSLPISLNIPLDLKFREEKGLFPDLWVPAEDALNYAVAAVRKGAITTVYPIPEEILQAEFIPEAQPMLSKLKPLLPVLYVAVLGILPAIINRKKDKRLFFIFGSFLAVFGIIILNRESSYGFVFPILAIVYITIGVYKWRKDNTAQ